MKGILSRLDALLDRLAAPDRLGVEESTLLVQEWDETMLHLENFPDSAEFSLLSGGDKLYLRIWLQRLLRRLPTVQAGVLAHKSALAKQLFSENRRFNALNSRYAAGGATLHQRA